MTLVAVTVLVVAMLLLPCFGQIFQASGSSGFRQFGLQAAMWAIAPAPTAE